MDRSRIYDCQTDFDGLESVTVNHLSPTLSEAMTMTRRILMTLLSTAILGLAPFTAGPGVAGVAANDRVREIPDQRAADAAAIRAHIESIFQAFIDGDIDKIYTTHSEDWRGILEGSEVPIKGIDEYMRANGIEWPRPANACWLCRPWIGTPSGAPSRERSPGWVRACP